MRRTGVWALYWIGTVWLAVGSAAILFGYIGAVVMAPTLAEGLAHLANLMSPLNVSNYLAVALTLAPGLWARQLAHRLRKVAK